MADEKQTTLATENKAAEEGSPKKGLRLLISRARWIVESVIAIILARLIWGKVDDLSAFEVTLSVLSIAALYGAIKYIGVIPFFKHVNYLNLYATFSVGLLLYWWLFNAFLPTAWIAYWWLPFLFLAPLFLKLPLVDLELINFIPRKLHRTLIGVAMVAISPFLLVYTIFQGILHPIQTVLYIKKKVPWAIAMRVLIGLIACAIAIGLLFPRFVPLIALLWGVMIYGVVAAVAFALQLSLMLLLKANAQKNLSWTGILMKLAKIIAYPFWIILSYALALKQDNAKFKWDITIPAMSISIGLFIYASIAALSIPRFVPTTILLCVAIIYFVAASSSIYFTSKPDLAGTLVSKIVTNFAQLITLPLWFVASITLSLRQERDKQDSQGQPQKQSEETEITKEQGKHSEQGAG